MTLNKQNISLVLISIAFVSVILYWSYADFQTLGYGEESSKITSTDSELQTSTLVNLDSDDGTENFQYSDFVMTNQSEDFEFRQSYLLWSRRPNKFHWNETEEICDSILNPSANFSDTVYMAKNWTIPYRHSDVSILNLLSNCTLFRRLVPFPTKPASEEEANFPLAYVIVGTKNMAQVTRLFRAIYQPQNAYCITYDNKSNENFKNAIKQLAKCFEGQHVFLTPKPQNIYYADYSILSSVMTCTEALLARSRKIPWRYVQVVSWNDFPLRTNYEMVRIFQILNGSQDSALSRNIEGFYVFYYDRRGDVIPNLHKSLAPDGLTMYKGSHATSMSREFIEFVFSNSTSQKLFKWLNGSKCPEELYWATLIHNVHLNAPGTFPGECQHFYAMRGRKKPFVSRYQIWNYSRDKCKGKLVNWSCVYGVQDLPSLAKRPELMAHKIYEEFEPLAAFCLEKLLWNRIGTRRTLLNETYYRTLPSVRYHKLKNKNEFVC